MLIDQARKHHALGKRRVDRVHSIAEVSNHVVKRSDGNDQPVLHRHRLRRRHLIIDRDDRRRRKHCDHHDSLARRSAPHDCQRSSGVTVSSSHFGLTGA